VELFLRPVLKGWPQKSGNGMPDPTLAFGQRPERRGPSARVGARPKTFKVHSDKRYEMMVYCVAGRVLLR